jgi:hypothetical protein
MIVKYSPIIEAQMCLFYSRLSEREQRLYAAVESQKFGYGGKSYIIGLFKIHHYTLNKGIGELTNPELYGIVGVNKQRLCGGGRKKKL